MKISWLCESGKKREKGGKNTRKSSKCKND